MTLDATVGEAVSVLALLAVLARALIRLRGWREASRRDRRRSFWSRRALPAGNAAAEAKRLGPVIGILVAMFLN